MKTALIPKSKAKTAYGLLSEIATLVISEPKRLDMGIVCLRGKILSETHRALVAPSCGTVGCIAGWALTLKGKTSEEEVNYGLLSEAQELLSLSNDEADELFEPIGLLDASEEERQTPRHARATAAHIARFQKKYRAQLLAKKV